MVSNSNCLRSDGNFELFCVLVDGFMEKKLKTNNNFALTVFLDYRFVIFFLVLKLLIELLAQSEGPMNSALSIYPSVRPFVRPSALGNVAFLGLTRFCFFA